VTEFRQPGAGGDAFEPAAHPEWANKLLLVLPLEYVTEIPTKFGDKDAVRADIVFLDHLTPDGQPFKLNGSMIFAGKLVGQTKGSVGGMVLGRLGQGANTKGNPPWELSDHSPQDAAVATQYLALNPIVKQPTNAQAAPVGAAPTEDPWAGVNAAAPAPSTPAPTAWGAPATPAAAAPGPQQQSWGATAPTPPVAPTAPDWAPGLADFLVSKGVDISKIPDENTARMVAASYGS
jgi:hypothetical protein